MIKRELILNQIKKAFQTSRIVSLLGPTRCGKTTIAMQIKQDSSDVYYFNALSHENLSKFNNPFNNPEETFAKLKGLIIIDEIQYRPDFLLYLRNLHDRGLEQNFLILGSFSKDLRQKAYENLHDRVSFIEVTPFSLSEVDDVNRLWLSGGFPSSYLAENALIGKDWMKNYLRAYIEEDFITSELVNITYLKENFLRILPYYHGRIMNYAKLGSFLRFGLKSMQDYVSYLESNFILRVLQPWNENSEKSMVKNPKVYFRDSGVLHYFLNVSNIDFLYNNKGFSFKGFCLEEVIRVHDVKSSDCYFAAANSEFELDLLIKKDNKKLVFKFTTKKKFSITKPMLLAMKELNLDSLTVIYPDGPKYMLSDKFLLKNMSMNRMAKDLNF